MSKDKGTKNVKKAPKDQSTGKSKIQSAYKSESKSGVGPLLIPKQEAKKEDNKKK